MMMSKIFALAGFWYLEGHIQKRLVAGMKARPNLTFNTDNAMRATKNVPSRNIFSETDAY